MSGDLPRLISSFRSLREAGEDFVLATIIATQGSTYRKAGARMMLSPAGACFGLLGGGSFEVDLLELARPIFIDHRARIVNSEMPSRKDADPGGAWHSDGIARILLQHHSPTNGYQPMALIAEAAQSPQTRLLITVTESSLPDIAAGTSFLFGDQAHLDMPADLVEEITATADTALASAHPMLVQHAAGGGEFEVFYAPIHRPLQLLVIGAGPDSEPLLRLAGLLGWHGTVADSRAAFCKAERFPDAVEVCTLTAAELRVRFNPDHFDAAVLMTRNFELDEMFLQTLADTGIPFIGLLGSRSRCARLLESLGQSGRRLGGRAYGPVGLDIQADTPEEIALAIAAQIQAKYDRRRRDERPETEIPAPSAGAAAEQAYAIILAAGGSRRFGGFKQLLEFRGESLLRRTVGLAASALPGRVVVVHGPKPLKCRRELAGCDVIHVNNDNWEAGMATSLKAGIRSLPESCTAALILLCDQPLIRPEQVASLIEAWRKDPDKIVASRYAGGIGVPAVIPRTYFPDMLKLAGDRGAKSILAAHQNEAIAIDLPEAELDIDTQDDYASILKRI
ncbi:MAG: NTP transferase domain-containing protein [Burkholderiales bacterium]